MASSAPPTKPQTLYDGLPLPKLIVFDLDYTLSPFEVALHLDGSVKAIKNGAAVVDRHGEEYFLNPDVPAILARARAKDVTMAVASRTMTPSLAKKVLKHLTVDTAVDGQSEGSMPVFDMLSHYEAHDDNKKIHMKNIARQSDNPFSEMLFFDDEPRNFAVEELGVTMRLVTVSRGLTFDEFDTGVRSWRKKNDRES